MAKKSKNLQNYRTDRTDRLDRPTARPIEPTDGRRVEAAAAAVPAAADSGADHKLQEPRIVMAVFGNC